ncbi:MAG: CRISPR-associated RAMP protein [Acidobacteria bacterium]|nr:MAG: CRISPR-associated RAMP protein [Acidobacteriota bacterium]
MNRLTLAERLVFEAEIVTETGLHVGSGSGGEAGSDSGVMRTADDRPLVPGSSLKGVFRTAAERIAHALGLRTCHLEPGHGCAGGDPDLAKKIRERVEQGNGDQVEVQLAENLCDTCRLFGSSLAAGKLAFEDTVPAEGSFSGRVEVRDGVGLDRDSRTARSGIKYDFEVVPAGARFPLRIVAENLEPAEKSLVCAVLLDWTRGFQLGGMTSRGLGRCRLEGLRAARFDLTSREGVLAMVTGGAGERLDEGALADLVTRHQPGKGAE